MTAFRAMFRSGNEHPSDGKIQTINRTVSCADLRFLQREMAWSRSALVADEKAALHVFICPRCNEIGETKTPVKAPKE
jgi:hypothetical protein